MNISFLLVNPSKVESPIRVQITHRGKVYRKSVGITTETRSWKRQRTGNASKDAALRLIRVGLESVLDEFSTEKAVLAALERVGKGEWSETPSKSLKSRRRPCFADYFKEWSERENAAKRQRGLAYRKVMEIMGESADWEDVDSAYYFRLVREMNEREYSKNYQGAIIGKLKTVMAEGYKLKYHSSEDFREFKKPSNEVDSVYLTDEELDRLWSLELSDPLEMRARDMLFLGCYSGGRWEDFSRLSLDNIHDKNLVYIQRKTGARVTLPCSAKIRAVLKRNGGKAPEIGDVVFNRTIKVVCLKAGITEPVQVRESKGDSYEHKTVPKWKMVSSHTCRRTLCTRLAQEGVPLNQIMKVSGHKSLASVQKYLRQSGVDTENVLGKLKYFK